MLDSDLLPMTIADDHRMQLWPRIFKKVRVHEDIVFRENASIALAMRKESPQLKMMLDGFVRENRVGTLVTNMLMTQFTEYTGWVKPALERNPFRRFEQLAGLFRTYGLQYDIDWFELENNVHAGTKYLALLRSHYFSDEDMDPTERMLFTMAGYNAGPNRINRLRRVAESRGLDPNIWFNNVELIVAAQVGREPINYVSNIYRYYIVYKRAELTIQDEE